MQKRLFSLALTFILTFTLSISVFAAVASPTPTTLTSAVGTNVESQQTIKAPEGYELTPIGRYSDVTPVSEGMIAVLVGKNSPDTTGLWGFVDATTGKEVAAPKYTTLDDMDTLELYVYRFIEGMAMVYVKDKGFTFIDKTGKELFPAGKYGDISDFVNGIAYVWKKDVGVGLIDKTGKEVVKPGTYNANLKNTDQFKENRIVVQKLDEKNNKWLTGVIDTTGKVVIPFGKYEFVDNFHDGLARASVGDFAKGRKFYIDINGKEVVSPQNGPNNLYGFSDFSGGLAEFGYLIETKVNERYGDVIVTGGYEYYSGYIDKTGKVVIPLTNKYNQNTAELFLNGYTTRWYGPAYDFMETDTNFTKQDIIDKTGKVVLSTTAKGERFRNASNGLVAKVVGMRERDVPYKTAVIVERLWAVYNLSTGKSLVPDGHNAGLANMTISPRGAFYDGDFPDGMIKVYNYDGKYDHVGVIDSQGKVIVPVDKYIDVDFYSEKKSAVQDKNGHWGYVYINGNEIIAPQFDRATPFREGKAVVGVYAGMGTARPGVEEAPEFNYYILAKKVNPLDTASTWAKDGIKQAIAKGFVPKELQNSYTNTITRAEFAKLAVKWLEFYSGKSIDAILSEKGLTRNSNAFSDTNDPDILAAYALGITSGTKSPTATEQGMFSPDGQFSREQAATMVRSTCKAAGMDVSNNNPAGFEDIDKASNWAVDGINFVKNEGIMGGTSTAPLLYSPKKTYTKEQSIITFSNIK